MTPQAMIDLFQKHVNAELAGLSGHNDGYDER